jgi:predicted MFS family arabinose efflux permease
MKLNIRSRVLSLTLIRSTPQAVALIVSLLLIEIAQTFGKSIGEVSQMIALSSTLGIFTALSLAFISVKYSPTHIQNAGVVLCTISIIGSIVAPSYSLFFLLYGLSVIGSNLIFSMNTTIAGEIFSGEERSKNIGIIMAGGALFYILGFIVVGYISEWRLAFTYFAAPFIILSLLSAFRNIPVVKVGNQKESVTIGVRRIFSSRSAVFRLISTAISGVWAVVITLAASFYRDVHGMPLLSVTLLAAGMGTVYAIGALIAGKYVFRFGIKRSNVVCRVLMGVLLIILMNVGNTLLSVSVILVLAFITEANIPAGTELTLRQVPEYKGSMMSLSSAMASLGSSINLAVMGYFLSKGGWGSGGIVVGGLGLTASVLIHLFVTETPDS